MKTTQRAALLASLLLGITAMGCDAGEGQTLAAGPTEGTINEDELGYQTGGGVVVAASDLPLAITSLTPGWAPLEGGTVVSILGQGISPTVEVRFGDALATNVSVLSSALVTCVAPPGVAGFVDVTLRESDSQDAVLPAAFEYRSELAIGQIEPNAGPAEGGYLVVIRGAGFDAGTTVSFGGQAVSGAQVESSKAITMTMPAGDPGPVDVTVRSAAGEEVTLPGGFERLASEVTVPPAIFSVLPSEGSTEGGTLVVLTGQGLDPGTVVRFGDNNAFEVNVQSDAFLTATTPPGDAGAVAVTIVTPGGETATLDPGFTYLDEIVEEVTLAHLSPSAGAASGGYLMMAVGTGMDQVAAVTLGGEPGVGLTAPSAHTLIFTAPPHAAGTVDLVLTALDGTETTAEAAFEYLDDGPAPEAAPALGSLSPTSGPDAGGTPVLLVGEGFHTDATVSFGEAAATETTWLGDGVLRAVTPAMAAGVVSVTVTNPDGQDTTKAAAFTVVEAGETPLAIETVTPSSGPTTGGGLITVSGAGFTDGLQLWFGATPATAVTVVDENTATATVPSGAVGPVAVIVVAGDGAWASLDAGYSYFTPESVSAQPPIVSGVLPASGWMEGGQTVLVTGLGLSADTLVHFGALQAEVSGAQGGTLLEVTTPAHAPGAVDVTVTSPEGLSTVLESGFVYFEPPPFVASIDPGSGLTSGGQAATIYGKNFADGASVQLGAIQITDAQVTSPTTIALTMPPHAEGAIDVTVTNPSGLADTLTSGFTYTVPEPEVAPVVGAVVPSDGPDSGGGLVVISGEHFAEDAAVHFGDVAATDVVVHAATVLTARVPGGDAGTTVDVSVHNPSGLSGALETAYTWNSTEMNVPLALGAVVPAQGDADGATVVTLAGAGFVPGTEVSFGDVPAVSTTWVSSSVLTAVTPAHDAGVVDVAVMRPDGQQVVAFNSFVFSEASAEVVAPLLASVSPAVGPVEGDTLVELHGLHLQETPTVWFGAAVSPEVTWVDPTLVVARAPAGQEGPVSVTVTHEDGGSAVLPAAFTYYTPTVITPPAVFAVDPFQGSSLGDDTITVSGNGFTAGVALFICGNKAEVTWSDATTITATTSPGPLGSCDVEAVNPDGLSGTLEAGFKYVPSTPTIANILPATGPLSGEISVVLHGDGFMEGASVRFGGVDSESVQVWSEVSIQAVVPPGMPGPVDVTVLNPGGVAGTAIEAFTYLDEVAESAPPVIEGLFPAAGSVDGGTPVEVAGSGFSEGLTVLLGGVVVTNAVLTDPGTLQLVTPPGTAGEVALTILNPDGLGATKPNAFTYLAEVQASPALLGVSPASGPQTGGTTVTVSAENLSEGGQLYLGDLPLVASVVVGDSVVTGITPPGPPGATDLTWIGSDGQHTTLPGAFDYVAGPTLSSVEPTLVDLAGGQPLTLFGTHLDPAVTVLVGDEPAQVLNVDGGFVVVVIVPASTEDGWTDVTAINPDGQAATLPSAFRYLAPPTITSLSPTEGPSEGGTPVQIEGTSLVAGTVVRFGDVEASQTNWVNDQLLVAVTAAQSPGPVDVTIETPVGQVLTLEGAFTHTNSGNLAPAPSGLEVIPAIGPTEGEITITILGEGFEPGAVVLFGSVPGESTFTAGDGVLSTQLPAQGAGEVIVTVVNPDGQTAVLPEVFVYEAELILGPGPALTALEPTVGPTAGGNLVSLYGAGLAEGLQVWFGSALAPTVTVVSEFEAQVAAPANSAGVVDVTLVSADGQIAVLPGGYTVAPAPSVFAVDPNSASALGGAAVTLTGAELLGGGGGEGQTTVLLCDDFSADAGCVPADPTTINVSDAGDTLSFLAPPHTPGTVDVAVVNPDGQSDALLQAFVYNPLPTVSEVSPALVSTVGGTVITLSGTGLQQGVAVTIGGEPCLEVQVATSESATCVTPAQPAGDRDITVTNPDGGEATLSAGLSFVLPPTLASVSPANGAEAGGYQVTLTGTGFVSGPLGSVVQFGLEVVPPEDTEVVSSDLIVVTVPAGTGLVAITITNPDGQVVTLSNAFFYVPPVPAPVLSTIVPSSGLTTGGYIVQVVGTGFLEGATVNFGQNETWTQATDVEIKNGGTLITMSAPPGLPGTAAVRVTNTDGQEVIVPGFFEYLAPEVSDALAVAAITPATGTLSGGHKIAVTGDGFLPGVYVQFGEEPLWTDGETVRLGPTLLQVTVPSAPTGLAGFVDVRVTNPSAAPEVVVIEDGYRYTAGAVFERMDGDRLPPEPREDLGAEIADINGDGHNDVMVYRRHTTDQYRTGRLMLNLSTEEGDVGWFERVWAWEGEYWLHDIEDLAVGDIDEDGDMDVVAIGVSHRLYYCLNNGSDDWDCDALSTQNCTGRDVTLTDLNCDGHLDITVGRYSENPSCPNQIWIGDGRGYFLLQDELLPPHYEHTNAMKAADVDLDGDLDLLIANGDAMQNRLYYNNCNNVARPPSCFDPPEDCDVVSNGDSVYAVCGNYIRHEEARARCQLAGMDLLQINDTAEAEFIDSYGREVWIDYSDAIEEGVHVWGTPSNTYEDWCTNQPSDTTGNEDCTEFDPSGTDGCIDDLSCDNSRRWICEIPNVVPECTEPWAIVDALYGAGKNFPISGGNTKDVALVDIDVNGFVDAIVGNDGQQTNIYMNFGGSFSLDSGLQWPQDGDTAVQQLHPADLDLDGDKDVVLRTSETIRIYLNDHSQGGAGSFTDDSAARLPEDPARGDMIGIAVGDLDGDLYPDIYVVNQHLSDRILLNRGYPSTPWIEDDRLPGGYFALNTQSRLPETTGDVRDAAFGDIDGDGDIDIVKCHFTQPVDIHINTGDGHFEDESDLRIDTAIYECAHNGLELADMDGDGDLDLVVDQIYEDCGDGQCNGSPVLFLNDGQGVFAIANESNFGTGNWQSRGLSIIDLDADGDLDLLSPGDYTHCCSNTTASFWRNLGDPFNTGEPYFVQDIDAAFSDAKNNGSYYNDIMDNVRASVFADIDGVPPLDLVLARNGQNQLFLGTPDYTYVPVTETWLPAVSDNSMEAILVDFDGDGDLDIYSANNGQDRAILREAEALFADVTTSSLPDSDAVRRKAEGGAAADLDGDGLPEIVIANRDERTTLLGNQGGGSFSDLSLNMPEDWDRSRDVHFIDIDGDGDLDLYLINDDQDRIYENQLVP